MSNSLSDIAVNGVDTRALSGLIIEFNIVRRNFRSYPPGHPLIENSLKKLLARYADLLGSADELSIAVARDSLMFENIHLDKNNPVYRDFARVLFQCGIGALIFRPGLSMSEAKSFLEILGMKREEITQAGGIDAVWERAGIVSLAIQAIRYDMFTASEGDADSSEAILPGEGLWERFARGLVEGSLDNSQGAADDLDPELLATLINQRYADNPDERQGNYLKTITEFMHQTERNSPLGNNGASDKLVRFIAGINPELRRQFLNNAFEDAGPSEKALAARLGNGITAEAVLEILDDINQQQMTMSPVIMGLLQKLSLHVPQQKNRTRRPEAEPDDFSDRMQTILREQTSEIYVPVDYQIRLNTLVAARRLPRLRRDEIEPLLTTIDSHQIETHISSILLELIVADQDPAECELLARSLSDMAGYFLQTGDYGDFLTILEQAGDLTKPEIFRNMLLEQCSQRDCLEEILNGLNVWGKPRYDQIRDLIWKIGTPFIAPLLDHLAEETSLSLRRFLIERLVEFGPAIHEPILERLHDHRWYFLRNLIILLKDAQNPKTLLALRPLTRHAHPRVRLEAFKTLLTCRDGFAEQLLLRELESSNRETQLAAIHLAEATKAPSAFNRLLLMLGQGGLSAAEVDIKCAVVKTLGEFGRDDALPELTRILFSRNLLHPILLAKLKLEIVTSLERYPLGAVQRLLQKAADGSDEIARKAGEVLRNMLRGKQA